jgi:hypothetical protein
MATRRAASQKSPASTGAGRGEKPSFGVYHAPAIPLASAPREGVRFSTGSARLLQGLVSLLKDQLCVLGRKSFSSPKSTSPVVPVRTQLYGCRLQIRQGVLLVAPLPYAIDGRKSSPCTRWPTCQTLVYSPGPHPNRGSLRASREKVLVDPVLVAIDVAKGGWPRRVPGTGAP